MSDVKYEKGDHILLRCSNCDCPLVDVIMIDTTNEFRTTLSANCHICGDKSFQTEVMGFFSPGHTEYATINDVDMTDGHVIWHTVKGEKSWPNQ